MFPMLACGGFPVGDQKNHTRSSISEALLERQEDGYLEIPAMDATFKSAERMWSPTIATGVSDQQCSDRFAPIATRDLLLQPLGERHGSTM